MWYPPDPESTETERRGGAHEERPGADAVRDLSGVVLTLQHQYEVIGERRSGGLATVWRGVLRGFEIPVDIVVLDGLRQQVELPTARRGIARRIAGLVEKASPVHSPHLLRVLDYGEFEDATPFFITDQSGGTTLADVISAQGRLPLSGTVQVIGEVARGLAALHVQGLGHLAVRPEHVSFGELPGGTVTRLGGLGLSLLRHELTLASPASSVGHIAPGTEESQSSSRAWQEALRGRQDSGDWDSELPSTDDAPTSPSPTDPAAFDVFGLAVLTYRCLTGRHPFLETDVAGEDPGETLRPVDEREPSPPAEHGIEIPAAVWQVLRSGLARDPGARPPGALAFAEALESAATPPAVVREAPRPAPLPAASPAPAVAIEAPPESARPSWMGIAIAVLAVTNLATLIVLFQGGRPPVVATEPPGAVWVAPVDINPDGPMPRADSEGAPEASRSGRSLTRKGSWRIHSPGAEPVEIVWDGEKITLRLVKSR